ncbi:MAG: glycosyltransferase family 9 protein [Gemmatimonadales bacterium]
MIPAPRRIVVSRVDGRGDVVMTLPLMGLLRERWPDTELCFLGGHHAAPIVGACGNVDRFAEWPSDPADGAGRVEALAALDADVIVHAGPCREVAWAARRARIPRRLGTNRRLYHWLTCTDLVNVGRAHSGLHEAQLNVRTAALFLARTDFAVSDLAPKIGLTRVKPLAAKLAVLVDPTRFNLVVQPMTGGSLPAWPLSRYTALTLALPPHRYQVFVTGSSEERQVLRPWLAQLPAHVTDLTGLSLEELMSFVREADGFVGACTGPLHIAAALGIRTLGLYPARSTRAVRRWWPLGDRVDVITAPAPASSADAHYAIDGISVAAVVGVIARWCAEKRYRVPDNQADPGRPEHAGTISPRC